MQYVELYVVSMQTESGYNLEFLSRYNLPRIMILHNAVCQHTLGTTNTDCFYLSSDTGHRDPLMGSTDRIILTQNDLFDRYALLINSSIPLR